MPAMINLRLPEGATVKGRWYSTMDEDYLDEDVVEVTLANGITIDVAYRKEDGGRFFITTFKTHFDSPLCEPWEATTPGQAGLMVELLALHFHRQ